MKQYLISVFQDTQRLLWENDYLCQLTSHAVMCTHVFPENFDITRVVGRYPTAISVTEERTLQAARRLVEKHTKVGVLNFANAVNPGGGVVYGAKAQEEDLCRSTNLYPCLMKPELYESFYGYNNSLNQYYSDRVIYSPNITVFKTAEENPQYTSEWYQIDVLTCPAPNLNGITVHDYGKLEKVYKSRIRNILAVAEAHGIQALVLGAFGCGAFSNPPELVAKAFCTELTEGDYKNTFREIVFAILDDSPQGVHNLEIFRSILCPWQTNPLYGKKVSILGDSITTFWGSNPEGYKIFYDAQKCLQHGIYSVDDTWWMKVLNYFGGTLLINNSYSGSRVSGSGTYAGHTDTRIYGLYDGQHLPDAIFVALGSNDYGNGVPLENDMEEIQTYEKYYQSFKTSYQMMLWKLCQVYPNAEIYCNTLGYGIWGNSTENPFPKGFQGIPVKEYNRVIRECVEEYGCHLVDLEKFQPYYETLDGMHPTVNGMQQIADGWIKAISNKEKSIFFNHEMGNNFIKAGIWSCCALLCIGVIGILMGLLL